ncbi:hypothetical protein [Halobaculum marinum]|uniref:Uncharacterized protein n=1 Tax=Halobaculum marinum TaxID=3031996 RepID=A0ABD5WTV8_9EURY|nr:hypothetical protein [Halobaculum sp. DT55]
MVVTNDNTELLSTDGMDRMRDEMDDVYAFTVAGSAVLLVAWVLFPGVSSSFQSEDLWGVLYIAGVAASQVALGWMY